MTEPEFWAMHPRTFIACQHAWARANGIDLEPEKTAAAKDLAAHEGLCAYIAAAKKRGAK